MSTSISAPLSCANNEKEINKERMKKATLAEMSLINFMVKCLIKKSYCTKVMPTQMYVRKIMVCETSHVKGRTRFTL